MKPYADILSENEIRFKYIRNQYLENERYDELMNNLIISAGKNINEFSKNVWMVDKDIKNLNENGHIVGLHSFRHPYVISKLSYEEQKLEYTKNYNHIFNITNNSIKSMSHPFNSYSKDTLSILSDMNITCGFRSNLNNKDDYKLNKLELPREDCANIIKLLN